jgi:apolipoprotein N-acyltransferase
MKEIFIKYFSPYEYDYTIQPGKSPVVFEVKGKAEASQDAGQPETGTQHIYRVVTPICFEDSVARATRNLIYAPDGTKQANMIVNLTNDGWYPDTDQCLQHFQIAVLRSVENRVPSARAVNTGVSGFIDSAGRVLLQVERSNMIQSVPGFANAKLTPDQRSTLWGRLGVMPMLVLFFFVLSLVVLDQLIKWAFYMALKRQARRAGLGSPAVQQVKNQGQTSESEKP